MATETVKLEVTPAVGDLVLSAGGSTVFLGEFVVGKRPDRLKIDWIGSSTTFRRKRYFSLHHEDAVEAKDFTPRKATTGGFGAWLVKTYVPKFADRRLFRIVYGGYEFLGLVRDGEKPTPKSRNAAAVPESARTFVEGAILYTSWGYDQTNIDWYEIVKRKGAFVWIREIGGRREENGWATGTTLPAPGHFIGPEMRKKVRVYKGDENSVRIESYASAWLWDGKPKRWSSYA